MPFKYRGVLMDNFTIRVTPEILMSASADITKTTERMKAVSTEMSSLVQRTSGYWTGTAADLHRTLFEEQLPQLEASIVKFVKQADKLNQIACNYSGATQVTKAMVEELPSDVII